MQPDGNAENTALIDTLDLFMPLAECVRGFSERSRAANVKRSAIKLQGRQLRSRDLAGYIVMHVARRRRMRGRGRIRQ